MSAAGLRAAASAAWLACSRPRILAAAMPYRPGSRPASTLRDAITSHGRPAAPCPASAASLAASRSGRKIARVAANAAAASRTSTVPAAAA